MSHLRGWPNSFEFLLPVREPNNILLRGEVYQPVSSRVLREYSNKDLRKMLRAVHILHKLLADLYPVFTQLLPVLEHELELPRVHNRVSGLFRC